MTANRREERLQDVPIAVSAITGATAAARGIIGTAQLPLLAPSLDTTRSANSMILFLRGVGFKSGAPNDEPSIALYIDGVYMPSENANYFNFNNIERIEVLKGPQGTLFGRNATGGVVQIITKEPSFDANGKASVGYANYDVVNADAYITAPINDKIAFDFAAQGSHQGKGWGKNVSGVAGVDGTETFKEDSYSLRGKLLFEPSSDTKIVLAGDYAYLKGPSLSGQPPKGGANIAGQGYPGRYNVLGEINDYSIVKSGGASLRIEQNLGGPTLTSISVYRKVNGFFFLDQDASPLEVVVATNDQRSRMYSQELQLRSGPESKLTWLIGAYYFNYKAGIDPLSVVNVGVNFFAFQKTDSKSIFGQATYPISDTVNLTGGLRYTKEKQEYDGSFQTTTGITLVGPVHDSQKESRVTWRASIDKKITPDVMVYASLNRGYKSGGYSLILVPGTAPPYKPEVLDAYEVGIKSAFLDRRLTIDTSAFYYDYTNIQFETIGPAFDFIRNGPSAKIYGLELQTQFRATDRVTLFGTGSYLHTRFGDFPDAPRFERIPASGITPAACLGAGSAAVPGTNCQLASYNGRGNQLAFAPKWTYNVGFTYSLPTSHGEWTLGSSVYYNDGSFASVANRLQNPRYYLVNANIRWTSPDEKYSVSLWGRNLANEFYYSQATEQNAPFGDTSRGTEPRTYGITATANF